MRLVYIAHSLGAGPDREDNRRKASRWVAWAAERGVAPVAPWITLSGEWDESKREQGLKVDLAVIARCDELWAVGTHISPGMAIEIEFAKQRRVRFADLTGLTEAEAARVA